MRKYVSLVIIYYIFYVIFNQLNPPGLLLSVIDVGQGDSIYLEYKKRFKLLIDTGTDEKSALYLRKLFFPLSCKLDALIITHLHKDHFGGTASIVDACKIGILWFNDVELSTKTFEQFTHLLKNNSRINEVESIFFIDKNIFYEDLKIYTLWPDQNYFKNFDPETDDLNQTSVILFVDYKDFEVLLTGDAGAEILDSIDYSQVLPLIASGLDVLKVPHHGSSTGLNAHTLALLKPKTCVISAGAKNTYGHPSPTVLKLLIDANCVIKRTDKDGTIEFKIK